MAVTVGSRTVTPSSPNGSVIPRFLRDSAGTDGGGCYRIAISVAMTELHDGRGRRLYLTGAERQMSGPGGLVA
jgi:hypothetical protein